ncbi:helix-turn-helix domain-containing protein [Streptomyces sp. NPDC054840]
MYGVRFTEPGVGKYLKRWGLTFQRPDKRAVEQDRKRSACGMRRPGPRSGQRRRPTVVRSSSPTRSASDPTRSPAAPGVPRGRLRSSAAPETGSP